MIKIHEMEKFTLEYQWELFMNKFPDAIKKSFSQHDITAMKKTFVEGMARTLSLFPEMDNEKFQKLGNELKSYMEDSNKANKSKLIN